MIFSAPMVRAILAGQKTQTRRLMKPQPTAEFQPTVGIGNRTLTDRRDGEQFPGPDEFAAFDENEFYPSRYGKPGDRLWVKETHAPHSPGPSAPGNGVLYRATEENPDQWLWRPSIFMPRWASRITLEITAIRVELLCSITEADAIAEGVDVFADGNGFTVPKANGRLGAWHRNPEECYRDLWESINGLRSWDDNPWVWVIEFRRVKP